MQLTVVVGRHPVLVPVAIPRRLLLLASFALRGLRGLAHLPVPVLHRQLELLARILQRAVRYAVVKVHDQPQRHPDGEAHQRQDAQLEYQVDVDRDGDGRNEWKSRR